MTVSQAQMVIGVSIHSSFSKIEQAYVDKLQKLHLQSVPGQPKSIRERAEQQIAKLKTAYEVLKSNATRNAQPIPASNRSYSQPQPFGGLPRQPARTPAQRPLIPAFPTPNIAVVASFVVAAVMMLLVLLLCIGNPADSAKRATAHLSVLSVPWCYVEVDGKCLGPSGQPSPFEIIEGRHTVKLKRDGYLLTKNFRLRKGQRILVKAQLDKGIINVIQE